MKKIHLWKDGSAKIDEDILRNAAISLVEHACNGMIGRNLGDSVFNEVTESRAGSKNYSSCGDLCAWLLARLGCRDEKLVNRNDDEGKTPWQSGVNISKLVYGSGNAWTACTPTQTPKPGDIVWIGNSDADTHVFVVDNFDLVGGVLQSFDYGQWFNGAPGGQHRTRKLSIQNGNVFADTRRVHGFIDLSKVFFASSAVVPDDFEGGVLDENPY